MTHEEFADLLRALTTAAEAGEGKRFARCFTPDAVYHDYIYGDHRGRAAIAHMLEGMFHRDAADYRWEMFDPVCNGALGYAWYLSTFTSKIPEFAGRRVVIDGMSRFELQGGLISDYSESVNGGVAMAQLGVAAPRLEKVLQRWSRELKARPAVKNYLERRGVQQA
jgi:ketosteroid isomerase-like protein